tara:strand:+ start:522 stop:2396 length:1875 start_codon:yes stop_codon:yes gene_type:complete
MAIKIPQQSGRLRRDNPVDRSAQNIRVNTPQYEKLFSTRMLTATAGDLVNYGQLDDAVRNFSNSIQELEDKRVTVENRLLQDEINKDLDQQLIDLASDDKSTLQDFLNLKEKAQRNALKKAETLKDRPSNQYNRFIQENALDEISNFRSKLASTYIEKKQQFVLNGTIKALDSDKNKLTQSTDATVLGNLFKTQRDSYKITNPNSPFLSLINLNYTPDKAKIHETDHAVTAIKKLASILLTKDEGDAGKIYRESDAKVYYNQEDYTQLKNYIADEKNQKKLAEALGLNLNKQEDKSYFDATIKVLNDEIKEQTPFIKEENDVHNNNLTNEIMDAYLAGNLKKAQELLEQNDFRGTDSAKIRRQTLEYINKKDMTVTLSHRIHTNKITDVVLSNPTKVFTLHTPIDGLNLPEKNLTNLSTLEAFRHNLIDLNSLRWFNNYYKQDPGQQKLLTRQRNQLERIYNSVRKPIENILSDLDGFSDAQYEYQRTIWDTAYNNGIKNNIDHNDLIASDIDTLRGLTTGNKKSIFWNAITIKPTIESTKESIGVTFARRNDDDLLTSPVGKTLIELLNKIDPDTGVKVTIERAQEIFLNEYKKDPNAIITFKAIINALRRKREEAERQADED